MPSKNNDKSVVLRIWDLVQYHYWGIHTLKVKWWFRKKRGEKNETLPKAPADRGYPADGSDTH